MASTYGREKLNDLGYKTEIVAVKAQGILFLTNLFMNSESLEFYKNIGYAMINGQVDIAVHSMKDVPTAVGIVQAAVLERATTLDILVHKEC
jgi:hydroxymethylbilane synthase